LDGIVGLLSFVCVLALAHLLSCAARLVDAGSIRTLSSPRFCQSPPIDTIPLVQIPPVSAIGAPWVLYLQQALH
jgi:hypothetical protein